MSFSQSDELRRAITPFLENLIKENTRECFRLHKAVVVTAPNSTTKLCEVRLVGQTTTLSLPYSTYVQNASVGDAVWVATTYNSWRNAIVFISIDFKVSTTKVVPYPVGSIYMSTNSTSPASIFGGVWLSIKDKFLYAVGTEHSSPMQSGGAKTHTLTIDELPSHTHDLLANNGTGGTVGVAGGTRTGTGFTASTNEAGGGQPFSIMPPYITVYMWRRIG